MSKFAVPRDNHNRTKYYYFFGFFYPSMSRLSLSPQQAQGTIPCGGLTVSETGLFDPQVAANSISQRYNTSGRFDLVSFQEVSKAQFEVMLEPSKE
jgi:hypothetical protein